MSESISPTSTLLRPSRAHSLALGMLLTMRTYSGGRAPSLSRCVVSTSSSGAMAAAAASRSFHEDESIQWTSSKTRIVRAPPSLAASTRTITLIVSSIRASPVSCLVASLSSMWIGSTSVSSGAILQKDSSSRSSSSA